MKKILFILFISVITTHAQPTEPGKKNGYIKKKDEKTNRLLYEGKFSDDKPVGRFKYYYSNDSVRAVVDFNPNGKTAYARLYHMNGKKMGEGKYLQKEIKDSTWTYYDEWGRLLSRERFRNGKKEGLSVVYLPDGTVAQERNYKNDIQHGTFREFFADKSLRSTGTYSEGELEGRATYYYPNGIEVATGFYRKGNKNGPWIYRTESGKIREKELYKNGVPASEKETIEFFEKNKPATSKAAPAKGESDKVKEKKK